MAVENVERNKAYWDDFYKHNHKHTPSQFCVCVLTEIDPHAVVVELGSGNGRDAHYFASQGHITLAMDLSHEAIKSCEDLARSRDIGHSTFFQGDITSRDAIRRITERARAESGGRSVVYYSRFVMHSVDDAQQATFLALLSEHMQPQETVYFEFRSKEDAELKKIYGGHFRRYIDTAAFTAALTDDHGFAVDYAITGRGMAKYKEEDPFVSRVIARKQGV